MTTTQRQTSSTSASPPEANWKRLAGPYKAFFEAKMHHVVEAWYNTFAHSTDRHTLKALVKEILSFDIENAKSNQLKATYDPDIPLANAIVWQHGGDLLTAEAKKKAVEWLSMAHPTKREQYRRVFGLIHRPSNFCTLRSNPDAKPVSLTNTATAGGGKHATTTGMRSLIGQEHIHPKSDMFHLPQNAQAGTKTAYSQTFVWKTTDIPLAFSERAAQRRETNLAQQKNDAELVDAVTRHMQSGVTTAFVIPEHLSSCRGSEGRVTEMEYPCGEKPLPYTPFGVLDTKNLDRTQWESVSHDVFKHTYYLEPMNTRTFQNLNDNYSRMLYLQLRKQKQLKKAASRSQSVSLEGTAAVTGSVSLAKDSDVNAWLSEKKKRPVSVIFPSI